MVCTDMASEELSPKQKLFVAEYLKDRNATAAYKRAGYKDTPSAQHNAARLMANDKVREAIDAATAACAARVELDQDWVLKRLNLISDRCVQGVPVLDREGNETGEWKFDSAGANRATELIGKHFGMFEDRVKHSGAVTTRVVRINLPPEAKPLDDNGFIERQTLNGAVPGSNHVNGDTATDAEANQ
jgi:phage terminase small subunit